MLWAKLYEKAKSKRPGAARPFVARNTRKFSLLRDLAADFAALVGCGVHIDVGLARGDVANLGIGQRRLAFERVLHAARAQVHLDAGIGARLGRSMDVRG